MDDQRQSQAQTQAAPAQSEPRPEDLALMRQYPTSFDLRARAQKNMPRFAFEYMDGGAG